MVNTKIFANLCKAYNKMAFTHSYIYGITKDGLVKAYVVRNGNESLASLASLDRASTKNGGTFSLKFKPNKNQVAILEEVAEEVKTICTTAYLENEFSTRPQNRGQIFEEMVATAFKGEQVTKKNAKFTESGDIVINGEHFQVKFQKATFTDERTIRNLSR